MTSCGENQELKPAGELLFSGKSKLTSIEITEVWKKSEPLIVSHGRSLDVLSLFGTPSSTALQSFSTRSWHVNTDRVVNNCFGVLHEGD